MGHCINMAHRKDRMEYHMVLLMGISKREIITADLKIMEQISNMSRACHTCSLMATQIVIIMVILHMEMAITVITVRLHMAMAIFPRHSG